MPAVKPVNRKTTACLWSSVFMERTESGLRCYLQHWPAITMSPGATASAESAGEFAQHEPSLPKPTVDWRDRKNISSAGSHCNISSGRRLSCSGKIGQWWDDEEEYNRIIGMLPEILPPILKCSFCSSSNPILNPPDVNMNIKALKNLNFSVVFSYHIDNPSARYADIVLPQMHTAFEGRDVPFKKYFCARKIFFAGNHEPEWKLFRLQAKVRRPAGWSQTAGWVCCRSQATGDCWNKYSRSWLMSPMISGWNRRNLHRKAYEQWVLREELLPEATELEEFQKKPIFRWMSKS